MKQASPCIDKFKFLCSRRILDNLVIFGQVVLDVTMINHVSTSHEGRNITVSRLEEQKLLGFKEDCTCLVTGCSWIWFSISKRQEIPAWQDFFEVFQNEEVLKFEMRSSGIVLLILSPAFFFFFSNCVATGLSVECVERSGRHRVPALVFGVARTCNTVWQGKRWLGVSSWWWSGFQNRRCWWKWSETSALPTNVSKSLLLKDEKKWCRSADKHRAGVWTFKTCYRKTSVRIGGGVFCFGFKNPGGNFTYKKEDLQVLTKRSFCNRSKFQQNHVLGNAHSPV